MQSRAVGVAITASALAAGSSNALVSSGEPVEYMAEYPGTVRCALASYSCEYRRGWKFVMLNPARVRSMVRVSRLSGSKPPWPKYLSFVTSAVAPLPVPLVSCAEPVA